MHPTPGRERASVSVLPADPPAELDGLLSFQAGEDDLPMPPCRLALAHREQPRFSPQSHRLLVSCIAAGCFRFISQIGATAAAGATDRLRGGCPVLRVAGSWLVRAKFASDAIPDGVAPFGPNSLETGRIRVLPGTLRSQPVFPGCEMAVTVVTAMQVRPPRR